MTPEADVPISRIGRLFWWAVALSLVVLFSPSTPSDGGLTGLDKLVHASLFAVLAASVRGRFGRGLWLVVLYAPISEVLQAVLPIHRDGNLPDAAADILGALLGWWWVGRRRLSAPV